MPWNNQSSGGGGGRRGGGGGGPWGQGPSGGPHQQPDLEELLKRSQDRLKQVIPGGGGPPGLLIFFAMLAGLVVASWFAFFYVVNFDENAIVLRFGKIDRQLKPGLHFRLPPPIEEVRVAKVQTEHVTNIGFEATGTGRGAGRDLPSESLMLTGDENIVVIGFTVQWRIRNPKEYLFNIQNPKDTVKEVAESAMREVVGQSGLTPLITKERGETETAVKKLLQEVLDYYGVGVEIQAVNIQKSEPPALVIDAFRDVQAAEADKVKYQNDASGYASKVVNEAKGEAQRILLTAQGYREQAIAEATGQTARFLKVYEEYKKAPEVTRKRLYLETMERVLGGADKIILDGKAGQGVVPYLPLDQLQKRKEGGN
jgi:membrane protease subunit HflK